MLLSGNTHTQKFVVSNFCKLRVAASQQVIPPEAISVDKSQQQFLLAHTYSEVRVEWQTTMNRR